MSIVSIALGALGWSLAEYSLHRFLGHAPRSTRGTKKRPGLFDGDFGSEHQAHHTDTRYFTPNARKAKTAAVVLPVVAAGGSLLVGPARAIGFVLGVGSAYAAYEILHRRIHTHAPTGPYSRWARRHHLYHHFGTPQLNHGVTSPLWDLVFGTYRAPVSQLRVPRRHAPDWLFDEQGEVASQYAADYVVPSRKPAPAGAELAG